MAEKIVGPRGGVYALKGPKRYTETLDYLAMIRRHVRNAGRRVGGEDMAELEALVLLRKDLDDTIRTAVQGLRSSGGYSWAEIGDTLGVTKQAAQQRYGPKR